MTGNGRSLLRKLLKAFAWLVLALLLIVLSWVAFNGPWADAPARARPAVLTPAPLQVGEPSAYALLRGEKTPADLFTGKPWQCGAPGMECAQVWLEQGEKLREQLKLLGDFGRVCEVASAEGASWVEPEPKLLEKNPGATAIPDYRKLNYCHRWLRAQAALAVLDGDDARALQTLRRADRAMRSALVGAQSLLGHAIAWSMARQQWQAVAVLARKRPQLAGQLLEVLRPLDPAAQRTERWIAHESAFPHAVMRDLQRNCEAAVGAHKNLGSWQDRLWCTGKLGMLFELSAQETDANVLQMIERTRDGALQSVAHPATAEPEPSLFAWRNSIGHVLVFVARPSWDQYFHKQAEMELGRQAAELVVRMTAERVPPAQRQAWLNAQVLQPETKDRFSLTADQLLAQPWRDDETAKKQLTLQLPNPP